jgi:hypothetical protein
MLSMIPDWLGIPEGYIYTRLSYESVAKLVVVELHSKSLGKGFLPTRLFVRHPEQNDYQPVVQWDSNLSSESAIFAGDGALAAFNSMKYRPAEEEFVGADWSGIYLWDLQTGLVSCCAKAEALVLPAGFSLGSVSELLGFSPDHKRINVVAGLHDSPNSYRVRQYIATLNLANQSIELITELKSTFY